MPWVEGSRTLLHKIPNGPGWAEIHSTPASFARHIVQTCTLEGLVMTRCTPNSLWLGTTTRGATGRLLGALTTGGWGGDTRQGWEGGGRISGGSEGQNGLQAV